MADGHPVAPDDNPFYEATVLGSHSWAGGFAFTAPFATSDGNTLRLEDIDSPFSPLVSGAVKLRVKQGWVVNVTISTSNFNYFTNVRADGQISHASGQQITTTLRGGDWLSIDVDDRWSGINSFTLGRTRKGETTWRNSSRMGFGPTDDDAWLRLLSVQRDGPPPASEETATPEHEVTPSGLDDLTTRGEETIKTGLVRLDEVGTKYGTLLAVVVVGLAIISVS